MDNDERELMREDCMRHEHHERQMYNDPEFFYQNTVETFYINQPSELIDVLEDLKKKCDAYGHEFGELLQYIKETV